MTNHILNKLVIINHCLQFKVDHCAKGIHSVNIESISFSESLLKNKIKFAHKDNQNPLIIYINEWFKAYFEDGFAPVFLEKFICWDDHSKQKFYNETWKTLLKNVPYGEIISYSKLAKLMSNPKASRAVGNAMKHNPIPLIIPCHRVIRDNGSLGNYSSGNQIKQWLILHEKNKNPNFIKSLSKFSYQRIHAI